jgi:hypothetical protein
MCEKQGSYGLMKTKEKKKNEAGSLVFMGWQE